MAHLPSYKSFNFHEVEEIERRVFSANPIKSDKELKKAAGSLNIQEERRHKSAHHENIHCSKWDSFQHNLISILHHPRKDSSVVVHVNEKFSDELTTVGDSSDEETLSIVLGRSIEGKSKGKKKKKVVIQNQVSVQISSPQIIDHHEHEEVVQRKLKFWSCFDCRCRKGRQKRP